MKHINTFIAISLAAGLLTVFLDLPTLVQFSVGVIGLGSGIAALRLALKKDRK